MYSSKKRPNNKEQQLESISRKFQIHGQFLSAAAVKVGHINETWSVTYDQGGVRVRYILQKINSGVFTNPKEMMDNIVRVTNHIHKKLREGKVDQAARKSLTVISTQDGKPFYFDTKDKEFWRMFLFIEGTTTYESVKTPEHAHQVGYAFGKFQSQLIDFPGKPLHETIKKFHDTRSRFNTLLVAVKADPHSRAESAINEIKFVLERESMVDIIIKGIAKGTIPKRITHNDTKLNNVMFDTKTGEALCVVDLDTVMPGSVLYDFGDMIRTATNTTFEDEVDLSRVHMSMPLFKALAKGYIKATSHFLTKNEKSLIAFSGKLITFELGMRFLTDYLNGDTYFRTHRPGHNLDRARTQFKLVESIEKQEVAMQKFVNSL